MCVQLLVHSKYLVVMSIHRYKAKSLQVPSSETYAQRVIEISRGKFRRWRTDNRRRSLRRKLMVVSLLRNAENYEAVDRIIAGQEIV